MSIGLAISTAGEADATGLLVTADKAMYAAKRQPPRRELTRHPNRTPTRRPRLTPPEPHP